MTNVYFTWLGCSGNERVSKAINQEESVCPLYKIHLCDPVMTSWIKLISRIFSIPTPSNLILIKESNMFIWIGFNLLWNIYLTGNVMTLPAWCIEGYIHEDWQTEAIENFPHGWRSGKQLVSMLLNYHVP